MSSMSGQVYRAVGPMAPTPGVLRLGTRRSRLAVAQSTQVAEAIANATGADVALITVTTEGDISRAPLSQLGGTGVFVSALREALQANSCDLAVHSYKDLPTSPCPGIAVGAVPARVDPRDAWCAKDGIAFADVPSGAIVGTGSPRRAAQVLARRPDLRVVDIRGNVDTRLRRLTEDLDAVVLAAAGLIRIGNVEAITERFSLKAAPTAPGQGALALEVRSEDLSEPLLALGLQAVEHRDTRIAATAERALLAELEAGCAAPVGATAAVRQSRVLLRAVAYRPDGAEYVEAEDWVALSSDKTDEAEAEQLGRRMARDLLARGAAEFVALGQSGADR